MQWQERSEIVGNRALPQKESGYDSDDDSDSSSIVHLDDDDVRDTVARRRVRLCWWLVDPVVLSVSDCPEFSTGRRSCI